MKSSVKNSVEV